MTCSARERILSAISEWISEHGEPPTLLDWSPTLARLNGHPEKAERFEREGRWPLSQRVAEAFGSWNAALAAAGEPHTHRGVWRSSQRHARGEAVDQAGMTVPWSREEVIAALQADRERLGRWPTSLEWEEEDPTARRPVAVTVQNLFDGRWSTALAAAGAVSTGTIQSALSRQRRERILAMLAAEPDIAGVEIARRLGTHPNVVFRHITRLRELGLTDVKLRRRGRPRA